MSESLLIFALAHQADAGEYTGPLIDAHSHVPNAVAIDPLFGEELAKGVVESGLDLAGSHSGLRIPETETLEDSLMARLDRLGEAKPVAQLGAAIGREFPYALLEAIAPLKELALRDGLGRLVEAELVYQRVSRPRSTYTLGNRTVGISHYNYYDFYRSAPQFTRYTLSAYIKTS